MTSDLVAVCFRAGDAPGLARFWARVLAWDVVEHDDVVDVVPREPAAYRLRFRADPVDKPAPNRTHLDLTSSSGEEQEAIVARALAAGGAHLDLGLAPEELHVPMTDPEGNELCVIEPANNFLAGTGTVGAINGEGSRAVGHFWSEALGWPLVWDQDEETAIQSPQGGSKIAWGGPPLPEQPPRNRLHLELAADDVDAEVERLVALGATRVGSRGALVELTDPDGTEFLLGPQP